MIFVQVFLYNQRIHFDNIQMINEATYEEDIGNIFHYIRSCLKIYRNTNRCVKIPEHINICTVAINDKTHKQTDKIKYDLVLIKCIIFLLNCHSKKCCSVTDVRNKNR